MKRSAAEAHRRSFWLTLLPMCLFAINLVWIPTVSKRQIEGKTVSLVLCSAIFWLSAAFSVWMLIRTERLRKPLAEGSVTDSGQRHPGLICFFQNLPASIADVLLLASLCVFFFGRLFEKPGTVLFPAVSAIVLLIIFHAMLNGRSYRLLCSIRNSERSESEKRHSR